MTTILWVWVLASSVGLVLSLLLTMHSWLDIVALDREGILNGRRWSARSRFAREGVRVTVHWTYLLLGIGAVVGTNVSVMVVAGLLYGNVALVINSLIDARTRQLIYRETGRLETPIERQDREVGDERRTRQAQEEE